jgi:hypothetical protein
MDRKEGTAKEILNGVPQALEVLAQRVGEVGDLVGRLRERLTSITFQEPKPAPPSEKTQVIRDPGSPLRQRIEVISSSLDLYREQLVDLQQSIDL